MVPQNLKLPKELTEKHTGFYLEVEMLNKVPKEYFDKFMKRLLNHPNYNLLKDEFFIDDKEMSIIKIIEKIPDREFESLEDFEKQYYPLCNKDEIKRIINVQNALDYLLKFTAEQILNNIRLYKVFIRLRKAKQKGWSLEANYHGNYYKFYGYYSDLPPYEREICEDVRTGIIHMPDANGQCIKSPYGNIIVISYALQYFLYYMNLFHYSGQYEFPSEDGFRSYLIGVRTMMGVESLDFEIDSRGDLPTDIDKIIKRRVHWQTQFVIGHEYAHHYLGHLNDPKLSLIKSSLISDYSTSNVPLFNHSQQNELDADYHAVTKPDFGDDDEREELANAAFLFFILLDIYQTSLHYMFPPNGSIQTHPNPLDRLWSLRSRLDNNVGFSENQPLHYIDYYKSFKNHLRSDFLPFNIEEIETYGSFYLPSFKKDFKIDHLDF